MPDLLVIEPLSANRWRADMPSTMAQGRSAFGGHLVGLGLRAVEALVGPGRPLRSVATEFIAPVEPRYVEISAELLRSGRALTQAEVRLYQDGTLAMIALFACGSSRSTQLASPLPCEPELPPGENRVALPYLEGIIPAFTQHFEHRWTRGAFPFTGAASDGFGGQIRAKGGRPVDAALILSFLDGWPCPVLPRATRTTPASTVTWLANFVRDVPACAADAWWHFETDAVASAEGYVDVDSRLFAPDGVLVATSRQLVVEFSG